MEIRMGKPERRPEGLPWGQALPHPPERTASRPGYASRWAPCDCCGPPQSFRSIPRYYFFFALLGAMESLAALATRNFTTVLAVILMAAPVAGFLPMRAWRFDLTSRPMPGRMKRPFFLVSFSAVVRQGLHKLAGNFVA